jgi:hydrogenase nickel incorporation protein HypA/HybF
VTIGQLSSIIDDSILFYWDIISKDTIAEGARIKFKRIPTQMVCLNCGNTYTPGDLDFDCPECGSSKIKIQSGREFFLESIDVE